MRKVHFAVSFALLTLLAAGLFRPSLKAQSQSSSDDGGRRIVHKVLPQYPEIARKMNITGTVKLMAIVAPDGKVKTVETLGGSPVLIQSAREAVSNWKFSPASAETRETIELRFTPESN